MVATQRIHVGMIAARKIVTVTADDHSFQLDMYGEPMGTVPRTTKPRNSSLQGLRDPEARRPEYYRLGPRQEKMNP